MPKDVWQVQKAAMRRTGLAAMILIAPENVAWTVGVEIPSQRIVRHRHAAVLMPAEGEPAMVVVNVEEGFARSRADVREIIAYNEFTEQPMRILADLLLQRRIQGRVGIEAAYLNHRDFQELTSALPPGVELWPMDPLIEELRARKTPSEVERLARAAGIAEQVAFEALRTWWPGMTEQDLAQRITEAFLANGGDKLTMLSVTAGERTPMLNGDPTRREIRAGEVVRIDVIGTVGCYYCDVARTAVVGDAGEELQGLWRKLVDCRDMALEMIRPGASSHAIYRRYIEKMEAWGLPTLNFLGHGLGVTLHEEPYLNRYADTRLEPGMVLAVEPLVLFPDLALQLEEAVVVEEDGCRLLTGRYPVSELWQMAEVVRS